MQVGDRAKTPAGVGTVTYVYADGAANVKIDGDMEAVYFTSDEVSTTLDENDTTRVTTEAVPRFAEGTRVRNVADGMILRITGVPDQPDSDGIYRYTASNGKDEYVVAEHAFIWEPLPKLSLSDILELLDDAIRDHFSRVMSHDLGGTTDVEIQYTGYSGGNEFTRSCRAYIKDYGDKAEGGDLQPVLDAAIERALWKKRNEVKALPRYR